MIEYGFFDSEITGYDEEGLPGRQRGFTDSIWKRTG